MNLKLKDILLAAVIGLLSFPILYFVILLMTNNMRVEFGPEKLLPEEEKKIEIMQQTAKAESLAVENSRIFQAIQKERAEIEKERERLKETEKRLALFESDLEAKKAEVIKEREKIESLVTRSDTLDRKRVARLAKTYAAMRPAEAAQIIETLADGLAVKIFQNINDDRQKGKILSALSKEKATRITNLMSAPTARKR